MSKTGVLTGGEEHPSSQLSLATKGQRYGRNSRNNKPDSSFLDFTGPDSEYSCPGGTGKKTCVDDNTYATAEVGLPTDIIYVFRNSDTTSWYDTGGATSDDVPYSNNPNNIPWSAAETTYALSNGGKPASTSRPYLHFMANRQNSAPMDDDSYYLQE